jgi:hypothetical protein
MHHVGVPLDGHERSQADRSELRHTPNVVPSQVHQHQVLCPFLGVCLQLVSEGSVLLGRRPARSRPRNRPEGDFAVFHPDQDLRRASDQVDIIAMEIVEVGSGIERAKVAIGEKGVRGRQIQPAG